MHYKIYFGANTYNVDAYGTGTYQELQGANTGQPAAGGPLANTGYDVIVPVTLGLAVVGASLIYLVKRLRTKKI